MQYNPSEGFFEAIKLWGRDGREPRVLLSTMEKKHERSEAQLSGKFDEIGSDTWVKLVSNEFGRVNVSTGLLVINVGLQVS